MVVATYVYLRSLWEEAGIETFIVGIWGPEAPRSAKTSTVVILSCLRNAIMPKSCFRRLCHSNFVNTLLYIAIFGTIPRLHRHRNLPQFLFKQSSASICTTVPKISNKSLLELFFSGTSRENFCPFSCQSPKTAANS